MVPVDSSDKRSLPCRYHPSDGSSLPNSADDLTLTEKGEDKSSGTLWKNFIISKPICLATFIILACITERKLMSLDPLNFNIFSIIFEVVRYVDKMTPLHKTMCAYWKEKTNRN